jgi:hypothetical protein
MVKPEYERAAGLAAEVGLPVAVARVNAHKQQELADRLDVGRFPTFFLYRNGAKENFPMLMTAEAYVYGLSRMLDVANGVAPAKTFAGAGDDFLPWLFWRGGEGSRLITTLVLYVPPELPASAAAETEGMESAFLAASKALIKNPTLRFARVVSAEIVEDLELPADKASLVLYTEHDEGRFEYAGPWDSASLEAWVDVHTVPLATVISHQNIAKYRKRVATLLLMFVTEPQVEEPATVSRLLAQLDDVAYELEAAGKITRGNFTAGLVNGKKYKSWMQHYGLRSDRLPSIGMEDVTTDAYFTLPDVWEEVCASTPLEGYALPDFCTPDKLVNTVVDPNGEAAEAQRGPPPPEPVTWVDVPVATVRAWLADYLDGKLKPIRTPGAGADAGSGTAATFV